MSGFLLLNGLVYKVCLRLHILEHWRLDKRAFETANRSDGGAV